MPSLRIPIGHSVIHDSNAGVLDARAAVAELRRSAKNHDAHLRYDAPVAGRDVHRDGVIVRAGGETISARRLVVSAGAFMGALIPAMAGMLKAWRVLTLTVRPGQGRAIPLRLGAFSVDRPDGLVFGIPDADGKGLKIGVDAGEVWDPEMPVRPPDADEVSVLRELLAAYVPGIDAEPAEDVVCLYSMTADRRFMVGPLADAPQLLAVSACSGHGFRFGAAIGKPQPTFTKVRVGRILTSSQYLRRGCKPTHARSL